MDKTAPFLILKRGDVSYRLVLCMECGLVYRNPRDNNITYEKEYFSISEENIMRLMRNARELFYRLRRWTCSGKVLDVGSGVGCYVKVAEELGWMAEGVEPSEFGVQYARERFGLNIVHGEIRKGIFPANYFDLILMVHVIEHLPDPSFTLNVLHGIARKGAYLYVSTPNIRSVNFRRSATRWEPLKIKEHLYFFSPNTLKKILLKSGWSVIRINTENLMVTAEDIKRIGIIQNSERLRKFFNTYMRTLKFGIRYIYGKIRPGDFIEVIAKKL